MAIGVVTNTKPSYVEDEFYKENIEDVSEIEGISLTPYQDCGLSIMNMLLMIHSLGIGGCCVGSIDRDITKSLLGLKRDEYLAILIAIGYIKRQVIKPTPRKELKDITHYIE